MADFKDAMIGLASGAERSVRTFQDLQNMRIQKEQSERLANLYNMQMDELKRGEQKVDLTALRSSMGDEEGQFLENVARSQGYIEADGTIKRKYTKQLMQDLETNPILKVQFEDMMISKYRNKVSDLGMKLQQLRDEGKDDTTNFENLKMKMGDYSDRLNKLLGRKDESMDTLIKLQDLRNKMLEGQKKQKELNAPGEQWETKILEDGTRVRVNKATGKEERISEPSKKTEESTTDIGRLQSSIMKSLYDEDGVPVEDPPQPALETVRAMAGKLGYDIAWTTKDKKKGLIGAGEPGTGVLGKINDYLWPDEEGAGAWQLIKKVEAEKVEETKPETSAATTEKPPDEKAIAKQMTGKAPGKYKINGKWTVEWDGKTAKIVK